MFIVKFQSGFANQLFQFALYLKLCENFSDDGVFADISHYKKCKDHGGFKLNHFIKLNYIDLSKVKNLNLINEKKINSTNFSKDENYFFDGYWQSENFFPREINLIKNIVSEKLLNKKNISYFDQIKNCNSVSIHIRRGDYVNNFLHGNIANITYFKNAIKYIKNEVQNPVFFIFSDDLQWCKKSITLDKSEVVFVQSNSSVDVEQDIILMSNCKHNIISNSSFSWWAQHLNQNKQKIVITPEYWFNQQTENVEELSVLNSIKIPNTPYYTKKIDKTFFSIIIPVYNTSATLRRTLSSVLNQTFENIEVIIVDDCSTDDSNKILQEYVRRDKRIKILKHKSNKASLSARLSGMKKATADYVLFLDSDDWLELEACQILYEQLIKKPVDMLEFKYIREPEKRVMDIPKNQDSRLKNLLCNKYPCTMWNKVYCIEIIKKVAANIKDFRCVYAEDYFFSIVFAYYAKTIDCIDVVLHHYMIGTGISTSFNYSDSKIEDIVSNVFLIKLNLEKFFTKNPINDNCLSECLNNLPKILVNLSRQMKSLDKRFFMLKLVDNKFSTDYYKKELQIIENQLFEYDDWFNKGIKHFIKLGALKILKKIIHIVRRRSYKK